MFKQFNVGDLFDIRPTKTYKMNNDELFATEGKTPVLSNSSADNGIGGYCGLDPTEPGNIITFSDTTTGANTMFYQAKPFIGYSHVQGMYPYQPNKWNEKSYLYVISCIRRAAGNDWDYARKFNRILVKKLPIKLPVIESSDPDHEYTVDDIDYEFMQERIVELEQERIVELETYLIASGLDDYELTDEDRETLALSPKSVSDQTNSLEIDCSDGQIAFKTFRVGDIFEKLTLKFIPARDFNKTFDVSKLRTSEFNLPLVNAKHGSNGIMYYGRKTEWEFCSMTIDIVEDGAASTGDVYAQPQETGVLYNAYLIKPKTEVKSAETLLYMAKCIEKITKEQFSYDKKSYVGRG